jgi:hypothetical protein
MCDKDSAALGYCMNHYQRFRKYGDATVVKQVQFHGLTPQERFWKYVVKTDGCWKWVGSKDSNGYGRLNVDGAPELAPRLSWMIHYGDIPEGKCVCHKCDNPSCTNPEHLFVGSYKDNTADMWNKGRAKPGVSLGEKHGMSKLTSETVRAIRNTPGTDIEVAKVFGISRVTVYDIRIGKTWKHLE